MARLINMRGAVAGLMASLLWAAGCDTEKHVTPRDVGASDVPVVDEILDAGLGSNGGATDGALDAQPVADVTGHIATTGYHAVPRRAYLHDEGGFGTAEMDGWRWGLCYTVRFAHPLDGVFGGEPVLARFIGPLAIDPANLPVAEGLPADDPRASLPGYPRSGDNLGVDAGHPGFDPADFSFDSGPVQRLIVRLGEGAGEGEVILPGGQSGYPESPHWADQARLWLANERIAIHFELQDIVNHGQGRWVLVPPGS